MRKVELIRRKHISRELRDRLSSEERNNGRRNDNNVWTDSKKISNNNFREHPIQFSWSTHAIPPVLALQYIPHIGLFLRDPAIKDIRPSSRPPKLLKFLSRTENMQYPSTPPPPLLGFLIIHTKPPNPPSQEK